MSCPFGHGASNGSGKAEKRKSSDLTYGSYLKVDELLGLQELQSETKRGKTAHDEMLFIVIHQSYELWFKLILHEMGSIMATFKASVIRESEMLRIVSQLERVSEVMKLLAGKILLLNTMTPSGFGEFRDLLETSSGFQSVQFRILENKLGVLPDLRVKYQAEPYHHVLHGQDLETVLAAEREPSLLRLVESWLERTPGLDLEQFAFWDTLRSNVMGELAERRAAAEQLADEAERARVLAQIESQTATYNSVFNKDEHDDYVRKGSRRLSHKATQGALMIWFYRDEPLFHLPFKMLQLLQDIDDSIIQWRHNHSTVVQRMIGSKMGSGGSSGYQYLRSTVSDRYKVFVDLNNLATFTVAPHLIPPLHPEFNKNARLS